MKHTKGPWIIVDRNPNDSACIVDTNGKEVLGTSEYIRTDEQDLQLIAAAPEMLEWMLEFKELVDMKVDLGWTPQQADKYYEIINRLI